MKCIATRPSNISIILNNSLGSVVSLNCPLRVPQSIVDCDEVLSFIFLPNKHTDVRDGKRD